MDSGQRGEDAALHTAPRREDAGSVCTCRWALHWVEGGGGGVWGRGLGQDVLGAQEVTLGVQSLPRLGHPHTLPLSAPVRGTFQVNSSP